MLVAPIPMNRPLGLFADVLSLREAGRVIPAPLETYVEEVLEDAVRIAKEDYDFQLKHFESINLAERLKRNPDFLKFMNKGWALPANASKLLALLDR